MKKAMYILLKIIIIIILVGPGILLPFWPILLTITPFIYWNIVDYNYSRTECWIVFGFIAVAFIYMMAFNKSFTKVTGILFDHTLLRLLNIPDLIFKYDTCQNEPEIEKENIIIPVSTYPIDISKEVNFMNNGITTDNQNNNTVVTDTPPKKKGKFAKILIIIFILIMILVLGRYFSHQRNPEPMQIQFADISMSIPGTMSQVTGSDYEEIFKSMDANADAEMAYMQEADSYGNTNKFFYALLYENSANVDLDELINNMEKAEGVSFKSTNYYIGNMDTRIIEHGNFPEPIEDFVERTVIFKKGDDMYMVSYIMEKTENIEKFYESIDTIR